MTDEERRYVTICRQKGEEARLFILLPRLFTATAFVYSHVAIPHQSKIGSEEPIFASFPPGEAFSGRPGGRPLRYCAQKFREGPRTIPDFSFSFLSPCSACKAGCAQPGRRRPSGSGRGYWRCRRPRWRIAGRPPQRSGHARSPPGHRS